MQRLITNIKTYDLVQPSAGTYPDFLEHMMKCDTFGLDQFTSSETIHRYVTSYTMKGNVSSAAWSETLYALTQDTSAAGASARSITYTLTHELCKSRFLSRYEALFIGAGDKLAYTTNCVYKMSVKNIDLSEPANEGKSTFTWNKLVNVYKVRPGEFKLMSMYHFAATYCITNNKAYIDIVPDFYGYNEHPNWTLKDEVSKCQLIFHKPWRSIAELEGETGYASELQSFMWISIYPPRLAVAIVQKKLKWKHDIITDGGIGRTHDDTANSASLDYQLPNSSQNGQAAAVIMSHYNVAEDSGSWADAEFAGLPYNGQHHDWSVKRDEPPFNAGQNLKKYKDAF
jgi:hypothetical protein